jgi:hypothetical protein
MAALLCVIARQALGKAGLRGTRFTVGLDQIGVEGRRSLELRGIDLRRPILLEPGSADVC